MLKLQFSVQNFVIEDNTKAIDHDTKDKKTPINPDHLYADPLMAPCELGQAVELSAVSIRDTTSTLTSSLSLDLGIYPASY